MEVAQTVDESGAVEQPASSLSAGPLGGESRKTLETSDSTFAHFS